VRERAKFLHLGEEPLVPDQAEVKDPQTDPSGAVAALQTEPPDRRGEDLLVEWDAGAMGCGELLIELRSRLLALPPGERFHLVALDPGAREDLPAWCRLTGHALERADHPHYTLVRRKDP
jgi:tRNA 2-thiouridine synthesizing protein A